MGRSLGSCDQHWTINVLSVLWISNKLPVSSAISGAFDGLAAPATVARLHRGIAKGARGAAVGDLTVTQAASGKLSGSVDLTAEQVEALKQGKLYVQLHTAKGVQPDGSTLWGWFLK